jgi:hypothetical protein
MARTAIMPFSKPLVLTLRSFGLYTLDLVRTLRVDSSFLTR